MNHLTTPYPSSVVFQSVFILFLSMPSMFMHTNSTMMFLFFSYLYSCWKNTKTVN